MFEFLQTLKAKFNIFVYTAGTKDYAEPILDYIDEQGEFFTGRLYRKNCIQAEKYFIKDLDIISEAYGVKKERVLLLDNSLISFTLCMTQGIPIPDFNGEAEEAEDQELEFAAQYIIELFEQEEDQNRLQKI